MKPDNIQESREFDEIEWVRRAQRVPFSTVSPLDIFSVNVCHFQVQLAKLAVDGIPWPPVELEPAGLTRVGSNIGCVRPSLSPPLLGSKLARPLLNINDHPRVMAVSGEFLIFNFIFYLYFYWPST